MKSWLPQHRWIEQLRKWRAMGRPRTLGREHWYMENTKGRDQHGPAIHARCA